METGTSDCQAQHRRRGRGGTAASIPPSRLIRSEMLLESFDSSASGWGAPAKYPECSEKRGRRSSRCGRFHFIGKRAQSRSAKIPVSFVGLAIVPPKTQHGSSLKYQSPWMVDPVNSFRIAFALSTICRRSPSQRPSVRLPALNQACFHIM